MNCQFFLKESLKTQCQIKGSLGGETLFESQEILTLSHIKTFPISASDMNKIILKLSEMRQQIPIQDISPGRYQTQTGKADLKHITVEDPTTQNKQMDKEAHQIALAIAELDDHSSQTSKTNLYLKIKQILTSSKTVPQEWTDALSRAQIGSNELQILAGAFAASQSPAAQRALIQIAKESGLTQKATQLVTLLGFTQHPTADTISSLSDYVKNLNLSPVKFQGLLALGILGNADNALGANSKSEIHQTIHQALASPSLDEQKSALAALGNMADSEAIQRIIGFVSSPSAALRQQAVTSLRKARWELVSAEFERALLDVDDGVVLAALRSLESMTAGQIEISQAVSRAMSKWKPTDHAEAIWQMGFKSILRHGHNARDVKQILSQLSQSLRSESLRQTALALLSS